MLSRGILYLACILFNCKSMMLHSLVSLSTSPKYSVLGSDTGNPDWGGCVAENNTILKAEREITFLLSLCLITAGEVELIFFFFKKTKPLLSKKVSLIPWI